MSTDQDYNASRKIPEQVIERAVQERLREYEAARRDPARVEMAFKELLWRYHPVAKMIRKGRDLTK